MALPDEVSIEKLQDATAQPRTLKATVSGRLDIAHLGDADHQEDNKAHQVHASQLSSIRMIGAGKNDA